MNIKTHISLSLLISLAFSSVASAQSEIDRIMSQTGTKINTSVSGDKVKRRGENKNIYNYQEVVYERLVQNEKQSYQVKDSGEVTGFSTENIAAYNKTLEAMAKEAKRSIDEQNNIQEKKNKFVFASGYCYLDNGLEVERISTYAYLKCDFKEPIGKATLAVSVTPDFYAKALIGTALYIEKDGNRFPVVSGVVLTKDKNSINIANLVNDRKIEKITTTGIYTATTVATKTAQAYLEMKQTASTTTDTNTIATSSGTTTVSGQNTKEIPLDNYLVSGALELVSSLSKVIGESIINELPYTFKIYPNSVFFVDVQLTNDEKIIGFSASNGTKGDMSVREPEFSLDGTVSNTESSSVRQREDKKK